MKRIFLLVAFVGAAISGFLWWKRREVERAESVTRDPWPSVVAETKAAAPQPAAPVSAISAQQPEPTQKPEAKKVAKKAVKKATKKVDADPTS
jgi:hypothetical protein